MNLLQSSANKNEVSLTIQGILMSLVPISLTLFQLANIEVSQTRLVEIIQQFSAIMAGIVMVYGLIRKFRNLVVETFKK